MLHMPMLMEKNLQMTLDNWSGQGNWYTHFGKKKEREKVQAYRIEFLTDW
jgi:hypothetical protein